VSPTLNVHVLIVHGQVINYGIIGEMFTGLDKRILSAIE